MTAPAVHLGVTAEAGPDRVAQIVFGVISSEFAGEFRALGPRPNKTHLSTQDIPKLWKFIKTEPAQIMADPGASGIIRHRPDGSQVTFGMFLHGSEFDNREAMASKANACLPIENRSAVCKTYCGRDQCQQRREHNQSDSGKEDIRRSLNPARPTGDGSMRAEPRGCGFPASCPSAPR